MKVLEKETVEEIKEVKTESKKRDVSIELIRVVAALLVVAIHLSLQVYNQYHSQVDWSSIVFYDNRIFHSKWS